MSRLRHEGENRRRRRARVGAGLALLAALAIGPPRGAGGAGAEPFCAPWPGEPSPLPDAANADSITAYWARMRADELARGAVAMERAGQAIAAYTAWLHAACLDPSRSDVAAGVARTRPLRVTQPRVRSVLAAPPATRASEVSDALLALGRAIPVPRPTPAPPPEPPRRARTLAPPSEPREPGADAAAAAARAAEIAAIDRSLAVADSLVRGARFDEGLSALATVRPRIEALGPDAEAAERRAQLEVLAGTATLALGREEDARASFRRALAANPELRLDPQTTSPKVLRALDSAREESRP